MLVEEEVGGSDIRREGEKAGGKVKESELGEAKRVEEVGGGEVRATLHTQAIARKRQQSILSLLPFPLRPPALHERQQPLTRHMLLPQQLLHSTVSAINTDATLILTRCRPTSSLLTIPRQ